MFMNKDILRLYLIASSASFKNPLKDLETAFNAGVTCFQLREKGADIKRGQVLTDFAREVKKLCSRYNVTFIINDDVKLAEAVEADGIHIGQDDINPDMLPEYFNNKIIGLSVGNLTELKSSSLARVSYLGIGPVFSTLSKSDAGEAIGTDGLRELVNHTELPTTAIGGITEKNYKECLKNGADGICVISAITGSDNIEQTVTALLQ
ncbi:Thiamine-phosphate synthase [Jeotgalicoccus coquinae]|uniref:Thiamine-phosphate synthase n=2 Tax=Jeotgalicoccus coquinae TaxID=709509 RepID=A0A6V7RNJ4_9STAP|nr:Thiamine-phosphate synthase [Jeotgalicoccus coquinae]